MQMPGGMPGGMPGMNGFTPGFNFTPGAGYGQEEDDEDSEEEEEEKKEEEDSAAQFIPCVKKDLHSRHSSFNNND